MVDAFDGLFAVEHFLRDPVGMVARDGKHGIPRPLDLEEDLVLDRLMRYVPVRGAVEEVVDLSPMLSFEDELEVVADGRPLGEAHGRAEILPERRVGVARAVLLEQAQQARKLGRRPFLLERQHEALRLSLAVRDVPNLREARVAVEVLVELLSDRATKP